MQNRINGKFADIVNKALIMKKNKGVDQAKSMMKRAGVPVDVIDRVLLQDQTINQFIRNSELKKERNKWKEKSKAKLKQIKIVKNVND